MSSADIYSKKWKKFLSRIWLFKFIPFVDFVFAAGSLATGNPRTERAEQSSHDGNPRTDRAEQSSHDGNIREESDFDVIIGVRQGRIFSVRMSCYLLFGMFGLWAKHPGRSKDRLCFNHFVTPAAYRLSPPYNEYWKNLYKSLVPVFGNPEAIQKFYDANADWIGERRIYAADTRHLYKKSNQINRICEWILSENSGSNIRTRVNLGPWLEKKLKSVQIKKFESGVRRIYADRPRHKAKKSNWIKQTREWLLGGTFGDWLKQITKAVQIGKINTGLKFKTSVYAPRIIFNDNELEFHPNTKRIEEYIKNLSK